MSEKHKLRIKYLIKLIVFVAPSILGTIGYFIEGLSISESLYYSVGLYVLNFYGDECNALLEIARWMAPVVTISGIFFIVKSVTQRAKNFLYCIFGNAKVIYCEGEEQQILKKNIKGSVLAKKESVYPGVNDCIIMLSDDMENLNFYYKNKRKFEKSNVYMRLEQIDSFLLRKNKIIFFNETELVARNYWKECNLLKYLHGDTMNVKIAIIGFDQLGQKLLSFGLMNNVYAKNQRIEYHIWGDNTITYENLFSQIDFMNDDQVIYHGEDWAKDLQEFAGYDRIIITQENHLELVQTLLYLCVDNEIDYYNKGDAMLENVFSGKLLRSFGAQSSILTEKNIMSEELYRIGMELNYSYNEHFSKETHEMRQKDIVMREMWDNLDGFTKASNIASADYHEIRFMILKRQGKEDHNFTEEEREWLSKAEHIRWCRFHFLNHWTYGTLEDGKRKDVNKRIHTYLVPYEKLPREVQMLDWDTISRLMKLKS